eukprot:TRINITY_DN8748_c0_g1_i1.p1 TRINITY_DN8748_c0_g1~~TRINITY_DN8748_c0_g1_i1.p1  ORF type:complete len:513 (+),score=72.24 TRINITY_DN8748_c0_g1_i1:128-1666(+)
MFRALRRPFSSLPSVAPETLLWRALREKNYTIRNLDAGVQMVQLPPGVRWLSPRVNSDKLFVRKCWRDLWDISCKLRTSREQGMLLTGSPGVGKSWFLNYALMRIAASTSPSSVSVVYQVASRPECLVFHRHKNEVTESLPIDEEAKAVLNSSIQNYYLFDPDDFQARGPMGFPAFTIVTSSPNKKHYSHFMKDCNSTSRRFMPIWRREELKAIFPYLEKAPRVEEVDALYNELNGILRSYMKARSDVRKQLKEAADECNPEAIATSGFFNDTAKEEATHRLLVYDVQDPEYKTVIVKPVSDSLFNLVLDAIDNHNSFRIKRFLNTKPTEGTRVLQGFMWKKWYHNYLTAGGEFKVRQVGETNVQTLILPRAQEVNDKIRDFCDVPNAICSTSDSRSCFFLLPTSKIASAFDSVASFSPSLGPLTWVDMEKKTSTISLSGLIAFQATVSETRKASASTVEKQLHALNYTDKPFDVFFVVPPVLFHSFTTDPLPRTIKSKLPNLRLWVLQVQM